MTATVGPAEARVLELSNEANERVDTRLDEIKDND